MSTFDIRNDAPGQLRAESLNITLKFDRTSDSTGRISWNIPTPAAGCLSGTQAYNGMIVVLDTVSPNVNKKPVEATVYQADNNVSVNLFAGDTIGTAKVIGSFYGDVTTTYFDVEGLTPNTPYYISGYPVDAQIRYYIEGVHAFSQNYAVNSKEPTSGYQVVVFNPFAETMGVKLSDATELTPGIQYSFKVTVGLAYQGPNPKDSTECNPTAPTYTVTVDGTKSQTYQDLLVEINRALALIQGGVQSPTPPNTNALFINDGILYQWDGYTHVVYTPYINNALQPNIATPNTLWYNPESKILKNWTGSPITWVDTPYIEFSSDPTMPTAFVTYWYDGTVGRYWNGATWCESYTTVSATDPSLAPILPPATYWYDTVNLALYNYDNVLDMWNAVTAVQYHIDPNSLPIGTYWFNESNNNLYMYQADWIEQINLTVSENEPLTPAPNKFWFNPATSELFQRSNDNTLWVQQDVIVFPSDPTVRTSCGLWWNYETDILYVWDTVNDEWVEITSFFQQATDPSLPPTMSEGNLWFDGTDLYLWNGACFKKITTTIFWATDPRNLATGTIWHNTTNGEWKIRAGSPAVWVDTQYPVIHSLFDPFVPANGTAWYDPDSEILSIWNGVAWIVVSFSTTPYTPTTGTLWYDTSTKQLKEWKNGTWVIATPFVLCEYDCNGNFKFTDTSNGSTSLIRLQEVTLFEALYAEYTFHDSKVGDDGFSSAPTYEEVGVGTDGSNDERLRIHTEIRLELGYPAVQVELSAEQMDHAITSAIRELRTRSGAGYNQGFFFTEVPHDTHTINLTNKNKNHNKIVEVLGVYRATSSFLASAHGAGVYGQIVIQHLYNMGTFDLLSYHIMSEYTKLMEILFAARVVYTFNEQKRELNLFNRFPYNERMVCIEAATERTEQEIMSDRRCRPWIVRWAGAMCRLMLAESRGKFSTVPGAGGAVTLNASDLRQQAKDAFDMCLADIDNQIVDNYQQYGSGSTFTFG